RIGAGASGRTGGMVLAETAAGDLHGLGDVLAGFPKILDALGVACDLSLGGAWEVGRHGGRRSSPIVWNDSGTLRVVNEVPGGSLDPGKLVSGLASAAQERGALIFEKRPVERVIWAKTPELKLAPGALRAGKILFATNALSLALTGLQDAHPRLTLAALSEPLSDRLLEEIGLGERKPFYTVDLPYLWMRLRQDNSIVWGAGLVSAPDSRHLERVNIRGRESTRMFESLERRIRQMHPALAKIRFTRRWGGPILFRDDWKPVFSWHPASSNAIVLGAFAGHGVALSSYLGAWAAEALLGQRELPRWGALAHSRR
ncbi:MAG TPA: FAD-binding oxidoreductase, partial [Candidatus Acidoferrales bacterium]|nr:FAD-binding oxidoreductase [Candidatus Acidoferrales bacterium]